MWGFRKKEYAIPVESVTVRGLWESSPEPTEEVISWMKTRCMNTRSHILPDSELEYIFKCSLDRSHNLEGVPHIGRTGNYIASWGTITSSNGKEDFISVNATMDSRNA